MPSLALSELIGAPVYDPSGTSPVGKVREVALLPQEDPNRVAGFIVKTRDGVRLPTADLHERPGTRHGPVDPLEQGPGGSGVAVLVEVLHEAGPTGHPGG